MLELSDWRDLMIQECIIQVAAAFQCSTPSLSLLRTGRSHWLADLLHLSLSDGQHGFLYLSGFHWRRFRQPFQRCQIQDTDPDFSDSRSVPPGSRFRYLLYRLLPFYGE